MKLQNLKYVDTLVSFQEVPNEISLCINFSNCPIRCPGCHSKHLWEDSGITLDVDWLDVLVTQQKGGITCICFMGGDSNPKQINTFAEHVRMSAAWNKYYENLKIAWYSGKDSISKDINLRNFDYIKLGPYIEELGGLDKEGSNQIMYKVDNMRLTDITHKFREKNKFEFFEKS